MFFIIIIIICDFTNYLHNHYEVEVELFCLKDNQKKTNEKAKEREEEVTKGADDLEDKGTAKGAEIAIGSVHLW